MPLEANGSYPTWYQSHLDNSIYLPLIQQTLHQMIVSWWVRYLLHLPPASHQPTGLL